MPSTLQRTRPAMTGAQKLLARACGRTHVDIGEVIYPVPELVIIHDGYVETAYRELTQLGSGPIRNPERTVFVTDHEVAYGSQRAVSRGGVIRKVAERWKI